MHACTHVRLRNSGIISINALWTLRGVEASRTCEFRRDKRSFPAPPPRPRMGIRATSSKDMPVLDGGGPSCPAGEKLTRWERQTGLLNGEVPPQRLLSTVRRDAPAADTEADLPTREARGPPAPLDRADGDGRSDPAAQATLASEGREAAVANKAALALSVAIGKLTIQGMISPRRGEAPRPPGSLQLLGEAAAPLDALLPGVPLHRPDELSSSPLGPPAPSSSQSSEADTLLLLVPSKLGKLWTLLKLSCGHVWVV